MKGPILIFGAGGFIGFNALLTILKKRKDVVGVSHDPNSNWRFNAGLFSAIHIKKCDMNKREKLTQILTEIKPRTILNFAAFGAYSYQKDLYNIYQTNFITTLNSIEIAKKIGFDAYVYAGTSSEYGLNCVAPKEQDELIPNSHYAVSKAAVSHLITYYGKIESLPITHLRLYSAYGPWEEPKRLIPQLILHAERGGFPPLVNPLISRDYVYVDDIVQVFIQSALHINKMKGSIFNVATGNKTTIRQLVRTVKSLANLKQKPVFSSMPNRDWDLVNWYGNATRLAIITQGKSFSSLEQGINETIKWHSIKKIWHL